MGEVWGGGDRPATTQPTNQQGKKERKKETNQPNNQPMPPPVHPPTRVPPDAADGVVLRLPVPAEVELVALGVVVDDEVHHLM